MFQEFPYTNFHELNLDWIVKIAKDFLDQYTHVQEVIQTGLDDLAESRETGLAELDQKRLDSLAELNQKTLDGLADLQTKYDTLDGLLQAWYDTHSADIAGQLASAITAFNTAAEDKSRILLDSWPADYSTLVTGYNSLKNLLSSYVSIIYKISDSDITAGSVSLGYKLLPSGFSEQNNSYQLAKYEVTAGTEYYIKTDDLFQFQNSSSVPASGTSNRVGLTYDGEGFVVKAPIGATYLIVSTLQTDGICIVRKVVSSVDDDIKNLTDAIDLSFEYKIPFVSGGYIPLANETTNLQTPTSSENYEYAVVPCKQGNKFIINADGDGTPRAWGFIENNGTTVITKADAYTKVVWHVLTAPENAGYLVINNQKVRSGESDSYAANKNELPEAAKMIFDTCKAIGNRIKVSPNYTNADWWLASNGGGDEKSGYTFDRYAVTAGDIIFLNVADCNSPTVWRFSSSETGNASNVVGELHRKGYKGFVEVPETATYLFIARQTADAITGLYSTEKQAGVVRGPVFMFVTNDKLRIICGDTAFGFVGKKYMSISSWSTVLDAGTACAIVMTPTGFKTVLFVTNTQQVPLLTNDIIIGFVWGRKVFTFGQPAIICNEVPLLNKWYQRTDIPTYVNNRKINNYSIGLRPSSHAIDYGYFFKFTNAYSDSGERWTYKYGDDLRQDYTGNGVFYQNTESISNKKVLCIGDSFTARGWYQQQILTHDATVQFVGTRETNHGNLMSEGYSGAAANQIFGHYYIDLSDGQTKVSPFWNPNAEGDNKVDFEYYCTENNIDPDIVIIMFGLNETNSVNYYNAVQDFVTKVKAYDPTIKTYVVEPMVQADLPANEHLPSNKGYECGLYWYILTDCIKIPGRTLLVDEYDYDTGTVVYGYGLNAHDGLSDAIHPSETVGFKKIGDQIYNWLGVSSNT